MKLIFCIFLFLLSCGEPQPILPFYQSANFTPEWISPSDSRYVSIHSIPEFELSNQFDKPVSEAALNGKLTVVNFFFTSCPGICKDLTANMSIIQKNFKHDPSVQMISISVTPEIDSVSALRAYAKQNAVNGDKWQLLTGSRATIYSLARQSFFADTEFDKPISKNNFLHTENFILLDKKRRIRGVYNGTLAFDMRRLSEDIRILKNEE